MEHTSGRICEGVVEFNWEEIVTLRQAPSYGRSLRGNHKGETRNPADKQQSFLYFLSEKNYIFTFPSWNYTSLGMMGHNLSIHEPNKPSLHYITVNYMQHHRVKKFFTVS